MSNIYSIHQKPTEGEPLIPASAAGPYPAIEVERENPRYAMMLMQDMASQKGEMTSIYQYLYEHWVLEEIYQKFRSCSSGSPQWKCITLIFSQAHSPPRR